MYLDESGSNFDSDVPSPNITSPVVLPAPKKTSSGRRKNSLSPARGRRSRKDTKNPDVHSSEVRRKRSVSRGKRETTMVATEAQELPKNMHLVSSFGK